MSNNFVLQLWFLISGIICASGTPWKEVRRFVLRNLRDFGFGKSSMEEMFHTEVTQFCQMLASKEGEPVSLQVNN